MAEDPSQPYATTRTRLLAAGLRLFAERGFAAVGVGDVERAAGLAPRRGALYRHFASKEALLEAAVQHYLDSVEQARAEFTHSEDADIRAAATALGWRILREMDAQRDITRILERDGDRLPELRDRFRTKVSDPAYTAVAAILRGWAGARRGMDTVAVLLVGALVNARRSAWTLGHAPADQDDAALITNWAALCVATVQAKR